MIRHFPKCVVFKGEVKDVVWLGGSGWEGLLGTDPPPAHPFSESAGADFLWRLCRLQELTVCSEDNVDVHDIELMQYINVDCSKLKKLLQGAFQR